jgi:RNA polymerase sigma-70 factor (ECF subfamily)
MDPRPPLEELLAMVREGKPDSLGQMLQSCANYVRLLASMQMDARLRSRLDASDLVQETFLKAHRDFHQFQGCTEGEFLAWIRQILAHTLAHAVEKHVLANKRDVRREVSLDRFRQALDRSTIQLEGMLAAPDATPSSHACRRESAVLLADRLADLSEDHRQVIILRHLEGASFQQVAERMERSEGAARMLWLRAIEQLRQLLKEDLADGGDEP